MKYEYKTVKTDAAYFNEEKLNELLNNLATQEWEYYNNIPCGTYPWTMLIFRRNSK